MLNIFFGDLLNFFCNFVILINEVASLAQLVEQLTLNQWVTGSSPVGGTQIIHKERPSMLHKSMLTDFFNEHYFR